MIMGNGGQVSITSSSLTRVLASHWSTRHRRRGDAKMMLQPPLAYMYERFPNLYGETLVISSIEVKYV